MNNNQKGSANALLIILVVILAVTVVYFAFIKKPQTVFEQIPVPVTTPTTTTSQPVKTPVSQTSGQQVQTTIYIPKNETAYNQMVDNGEAGTKPDTTSLTAADFKTQQVAVTTTSSYGIEQASADAAAATVQSQTVIKTIGFKVVGSTAYVVLNINVDGWAGVSYSIDAVTPIIKQTLLQFPGIKNVEIGTDKAFSVTGVPRP
ncbi:MAG: hypothetical protein ABIO57_02040 [Candidatus Paceibacterota bacterium]